MVTGIYVRVSTEEQAKEGYSIRAQEEKLKQYATLKDWHIYSVYADEGISGKDIDGRPAIKRLIADITSGKVKNVLVYKIDRLTRSTKNLIELVELFNQNKCAFNSLNESIDTATATGRMFLKIIGIFAEFERENLVERVRLGFERKAREGHSNSAGITSYGYSRENGSKIQKIENEQAQIVRRIFNMYLHDNYNFSRIAKTLNAENIASKRGKKWLIVAIKDILTNPNYIGKVRYAVRDTARYFENDGQHEPIIDESTFYQVEERINKTKKISRTKYPSSGVYFCGVLYCALCGAKYSTHWNYSNWHKKNKKTEEGQQSPRYPSYRCMNNFNFNNDCRAKAVRHIKVEQAFEEYIMQYENFEKFDDLETDSTSSSDHNAEIETINAEIGQIERKHEEIMSLFVANSIDFSTYQGMIKLSNVRRVELETRLNLLQKTTQDVVYKYSVKEIVSDFREQWAVLNNEQRQQFVQKFVKKIVMHGELPTKGNINEAVIGDILFNEF